ncbi:hypothetical protein AB0387_20025 [Streptomyces sp. NPDC089173]|uniref:hypothetical protein n=1 Tax=Streptomyces sp. NPDC089173 TaxID=3154965 RepID=UPI00344DE056
MPQLRTATRGAIPLAGPTLPILVPYLPPMIREMERCLCGQSGLTCEESMCRSCREDAVVVHGQRLARLLSAIRYEHRGVTLTWTEASSHASAFTPRVSFLMPDVYDPQGPPHLFRGFAYWEDDQLIAACARGASDDEILSLALSMAHYALATLAIHELDEWYTYRSVQVYPPHRRDQHLPRDEDRGPDGNGAVVLWLAYTGPAHAEAGQVPDVPLMPTHVPVHREDVAIMPRQALCMGATAIQVTPPASAVTTSNQWTAPRDGEDVLAAALRDIHHTMVLSELSVVARNLTLAGSPAFAARPGSAEGDRLTWDAYLTYDG